jgi:hypothetical protein
MFARSFFIVLPAAFCLASTSNIGAQSAASIGWPPTKNPPPDMIKVIDTPARPQALVVASELSRSDRKLIKPDEADEKRFQALLGNSDYGIVKLLNVKCGDDDAKVVRVSECRDSIPGHGADFSFRTGKHSFPGIADLKLRENTLVVGSVMTQGLLVFVGQVDLQTLDVSSNSFKFVSEFAPATDRHGAERQASEINAGIIKYRLLVCSSAYVRENQTYVLRSIAYRTNNDGGDKRKDLIVAFTVIRQDADGNVTLIWRRLQEKDAPKLSFKE